MSKPDRRTKNPLPLSMGSLKFMVLLATAILPLVEWVTEYVARCIWQMAAGPVNRS